MDMITANFPLQKNIDITKTAALWMATFRNQPDDVMETAIMLVLSSNKHWPTIADVNSAISELQREIRSEPQLQYLPSRSDWTSPIAAKAMAMVKSGQSKQYLDEVDITTVRDYAKTKFFEISDDSIRRNYNELHTAMSYEERCKNCMWDSGECDTAGFYVVPAMRPDGLITTDYTMCTKHSLYGKDLRKYKKGGINQC